MLLRDVMVRGGKLLLYLVSLMLIAFLLGGCGTQKPVPKPVPPLPRVAEGVSVDGAVMGGMTEDEVRQSLSQMAAEKNSQPQPARFDDTTGEIAPEQTGRMMDIDATVTKIMTALPHTSHSAVYLEVAPPLTMAVLKQAIQAGAYTTPILDTSPGRMNNIRLTAKLVNNFIIPPGSEFSFNRVTGEPTKERGFEEATVIGPGKVKTEGIGGGMCQVSSTLYNAVLAAKLKVTERHSHSLPVNYVPPGQDATTFTDKDFRFTNTTAAPLMIRAFTHRDNLTVDLWALPR